MLETHILPNGEEVTFDPDIHQYYVKGNPVLSVTQLIDKKYGNNYGAVNPEILKAASEYGTNVHEELRDFIEKRKIDPSTELFSVYPEVYNYFSRVENLYKVKPLINEKVVALYAPDGSVMACGRFDMIANILGVDTVADFKTTSAINRQHVTAQLNLYLKAAYQSGYITSTNYNVGVIHLSGDKARYVPMTKLSDDFYLTFIDIKENS